MAKKFLRNQTIKKGTFLTDRKHLEMSSNKPEKTRGRMDYEIRK